MHAFGKFCFSMMGRSQVYIFSITDEMGINSTIDEINQNYILEKWVFPIWFIKPIHFI